MEKSSHGVHNPVVVITDITFNKVMAILKNFYQQLTYAPC
jgi:hypothetical protein